jgi:hypothetical protein
VGEVSRYAVVTHAMCDESDTAHTVRCYAAGGNPIRVKRQELKVDVSLAAICAHATKSSRHDFAANLSSTKARSPSPVAPSALSVSALQSEAQ